MYGMDDAVVALTLRAVVRAGLQGRALRRRGADVREDGGQDEWVRHQLRSALDGLDERFAELITVAYEPIWAIGTGAHGRRTQVAGHDDATCARSSARWSSATPAVLYGGSVNAENAASLVAEGRRRIPGRWREPQGRVVPCHSSGL